MAVQKRGLGRGLDALLGEITPKDGGMAADDSVVAVAKQQPQNLPIEYLQRGKYQPRKDMNPEKLQELADSIKAQGIIQPIVVRQVAAEKYEIVAGERRWRAAQLASLPEVPVLIREIDDRAAMAIALIENIQREDLNPLEEADALRKLLDEFAMTHQQIADAVGKSRVTVTNLLRLLELNFEVKKLLVNRQLEMGHARALLSLGDPQQLAIAQKIVKDGLSVRAAEQLVKQSHAEPKTPAEKRLDNDTLRLQDELTAKLGAKVVIDHKDHGGGKVVISYTSLDELDGIIGQIK
ncbi:ParB/RepB/Spo0J family partition protein [Methylovulum psychrotolerans]|jgi:ParB family chromosome partitioning protein|uniref:Probable chromosome-partitioning protein ParB n=1 Tax=Methylovulum psychrotolerans TaxID=1704499 RepID=A0A1Z4C343_9GAMM|nr:ParB/RepB/Spo0J family partition protein [Methylovulum psychrotolerans]ASF47934.1 chromosome partitioning protein ParB [Methylovulum psychrotolerans]MBT9096266.1 ParB/RepB/Spo0J family partition protein [Methylovulum psychrotolerans]POZ52390.1 chromosome partitioning protein ParB [Methylovulum psychrotolerans]